ncbi:MAG: NADH-quinone oxidoreductase subunit C [Cyclobacteriaceae bacterium]|nr:NADH-quinone oxidoreductase subunit C [Cyclobacteriaceae bacterium]
MQPVRVFNQATIPVRQIPVLNYSLFAKQALALLKEENNHCVSYFGYQQDGQILLVMAIAEDTTHTIALLAHQLKVEDELTLPSLTPDHYPLHVFEREIHENLGIHFSGHPWLKPVRYPVNRANPDSIIGNYPFYQIQGGEVHQVGVGPIHAGVIEPGHFRFICNGEKVLHLEIQLGWQHRGIELLFLTRKSLLQQTILSESIAGDTAIGHATAYVQLMESLSSIPIPEALEVERTIALELERIAMHVGDLSNMNIGLAYQLGASVFGTLRTPVINFMQTWCGNRFGKGLLRAGGTHYPLTDEKKAKLTDLLNRFERSYLPMAERMFSLPTVLMRMEQIGKVTDRQMKLIGAVGMTARMAGVERDIRMSHPTAAYRRFQPESKVLVTGDVLARARLRDLEIRESILLIRELLGHHQSHETKPAPSANSVPDQFCISLVEGWRGEICHTAVTGPDGTLLHYKVKDPSLHNWFALALSLRDLEISDFPINNKSYNLSYCGHDL